MKKPELLLPAGNSENFFAAVEGGADAVYLGLKEFNARGRALNFSSGQLVELLKEAKKKNVKVYVTLNTVIKNEELPQLFDVLDMLSQTGIAAVIVQDWGVLGLIKKHFPQLKIHASTQMANHNSSGVNHAEKVGFERVILARELTFRELKLIKRKTKLELEIFVHGALCYSFSGMCLFSSYLGGSGANRGHCTQPCRRNYNTGNSSKYVFSLKDNQVIDRVPELSEMGIASLKIEGRLKSAEYVHKVAQAYRKVIDNPLALPEAHELLKYDFGREKTAYFLGGKVNESITENPNTGLLTGIVWAVNKETITLQSDIELEKGYRVRVRSKTGDDQVAIKLKEVTVDEKGNYVVPYTEKGIRRGDLVFLADFRQDKFKARIDDEGVKLKKQIPPAKRDTILKNLVSGDRLRREEIYVRIDSLKWMRKLHLNEIEGVILRFSQKEWQEFKPNVPFVQKNIHKFIVELPKFIAEEEQDNYKELSLRLKRAGFGRFMVSHLSQSLLLPPGVEISANENVYAYNDAAIAFIRSQGIKMWAYPQENDSENLFAGKDRSGIVPVYFYPELFYSRMPVKLDRTEETFADDKEFRFKRIMREGITTVIPDKPVALLHYHKQLRAEGFRRFLIDFCGESESKNVYKRVFSKFAFNEQIQPSTAFNFKKGLK